MSDVEIVKDCLNTILEKGDIYDTIAVRENVKLLRHSFYRQHLLLFSRILYGGVRAVEKVKSLFSPIEEVKEAQDKIRGILGVNIDIIRSKHEFDLYTDFVVSSNQSIIQLLKSAYKSSKNPSLSIFYENFNVGVDEYVDHLKKILTFCELYNIEEVLLSEDDILYTFPDLDSELEGYCHTTMKKVLDCEVMQVPTAENDEEDKKYREIYNVRDTFNSSILQLNTSELRTLIRQLEVVKISKRTVFNLGKKIEDIPVKNAISYFFQRGDLDKLKEIVSSRLTLMINSDSSYKDREYGKVFRNATIKDEYINIISTNQNGEVVSNIVTTLYDYLEVADYRTILRQIKLKDDDQELFALTALHLYLCQSVKIVKSNQQNWISFYDYIYNTFKAKKSGRVKKIPGMYTKGDRRSKSATHAFSNTLITILLSAVVVFTGMSFSFIQEVAFGRESGDVIDNIANVVFTPYLKSYEFEKSLVEEFIHFTRDIKIDFSNILKSFSGDSNEGFAQSDRVIASVSKIVETDLPTYFGTGYAVSGNYDNGQMVYQIEQQVVKTSDFHYVLPLFDVSIHIGSESLVNCIDENKINLPKLFYPLDSGEDSLNYVLTKVYIYDATNDYTAFVLDYDRVARWGNYITLDEMEALKTMAMPTIVYVYGVDFGMNPFVENIKKESNYTENSPADIRKAIIKGLGLSESASDEEIYAAVLSKDYSITPIKDAGLSWRIKWQNEKKYFQTIASLDSLICNLAATLAVGTNEELIYTIGYYNADDLYIRENEAHAWAMSRDGEIIDITPSGELEKEEESTFISKLIDWGADHDIPLYALLATIVLILNSVFGKKVRFHINIRKVEKILTRPDIEESYAKLKEALYGGINYPCSRPPIQLLEVVEKEFGGFTLQELKEIREELLNSDFNFDGELDSALQLLTEVPFVRQNYAKVKTKLKKNNDFDRK